MEENINTPSAAEPRSNSSLMISIAIVGAGALIAGAIIWNGQGEAVAGAPSPGGNLKALAPVTEKDHIRGNPNAPVVLVEFSDFECPYCKSFHATLQRVMSEYGASGEVAWVYRHMPIDQLHRKARTEALAAECAASLGGEDAFWKFTDRMFALSQTNDRTDTDVVIPQIINELGLDEAAIAACIASEQFAEKIERDIADGAASGGNGTPWTVVIGRDGQKYPLSGSQPWNVVKQLVELAKK